LKAKAQALILNPAAGTTAETLLKQLAEYQDRIDGVQLLSHFPYLSDKVRASAGSVTEGMIIVATPVITDSRIDMIKSAAGKEFKGLDDFMIATVADGLRNLVAVVEAAKRNQTNPMQELVNKKLDGIAVEGLKFGNSNMLNGYESGIYQVVGGKAVGE